MRWPTVDELGFDPDEPFVGPDGTNLQGYVWHCHMLDHEDHEDHEMMRRLRVVDPAGTRPDVLMPMPMGGEHSDHSGHGG